MQFKKHGAALAALLLAACGGEQQIQPVDEKSSLQKTLQPQLDALEKAKGVEEALEQQKQDLDKRMAEQGI